MALESFHPAVQSWFRKEFAHPTGPQLQAWPAIKSGKHTLVAAPTGSGKTLAAFLAAIDDLVRQGTAGELKDETQVLYVSPLKALSNDIQKNLQAPLAGVQVELQSLGLEAPEIRVLVRTGDTPASERARMTKRPPHIVVTTPESLFILLTSEGGRGILKSVRTLIVDEIHAMVRDKRGAHLALSVERLEALVGSPLVRVGLSATQRPIEEVARFLVGAANIGADGSPNCTIVDSGHVRKLDLAIELPPSPLEPVMSAEVWDEVYDRLAELIGQHKSTLVFVNTRRLSERVCRHLGERIGEDSITSHHGSLSRDKRLSAEQRLKAGELRALVATASLELGIDIGAIDLVCQIGSTRSIAAFLQRVGRSGHQITGTPKGRIFPLSRDELVECAALLDSVRRGELDQVSIPEQPLDILAQQIVAATASGDWNEDELFELIGRSYPYRRLARHDFDQVIRMLADGFTTRRGRRSAYIHYDAVNKHLRGRRGARLAAITSGGAIPDTADYQVILEPGEIPIGSVNEDFAIESLRGDIFQLGNASWQILRVEPGKVRVQDAHGQPPTIPFWVGEAPGRTAELSVSVSRLRTEIADKLDLEPIAKDDPDWFSRSAARAMEWMGKEIGLDRAAGEQIAAYMAATKLTLGAIPSLDQIVIERFFDESGGAQLIVHSPYGSRLNRAWGLALRKRFCRKFNFELQAAATEDAIIISLSAVHSFPLEDVQRYLKSESVRDVLIQALLDAPMFAIRWRWNASRALAILRWSGGRKVAPQLQRMQAEDLLAIIFPDQLACAENITGQREIPDHPLVGQTIRDCLDEAMDIKGLEALLARLEAGSVRVIVRELTEPSPLAQEILSARPYAFLDDAPLEERRTQAVMSRRWLDPQTASDLGKLDQAAIDRVRDESWPQVESADELHDALMQLGFLTEVEGRTGMRPRNRGAGTIGSEPQTDKGAAESGETPSAPEPGWPVFLQTLGEERRAAILKPAGGGPSLWVAAERLPQLLPLFLGAILSPSISPPESYASEQWTAEKGLVEVIRGRLEALGPVSASDLAGQSGIDRPDIDAALASLEGEGFVLRGRFSEDAPETEWCVRRLLSRIHSYTLNRLRKEVEPVAVTDFIRFLLEWQKVSEEQQAEGQEALAAIIEQLEGFEAPAAAWESEILPSRMKEYDPAWLDALCLSGRVTWLRLTPPRPAADKWRISGPVKHSPICVMRRNSLECWREFTQPADRTADEISPAGINLSHEGRAVLDYLTTAGASFFADLVDGSRLLKSQAEDALGELVSWGLVTADSFAGLRALLTPSNKRPTALNRRHRVQIYGMDNAGRWSLIQAGRERTQPQSPSESGPTGRYASVGNGAKQAAYDEQVTKAAYTLLRRYGVVVRRLLEREDLAPPWRDLLKVYRRLEARGEIRGGRFVSGLTGEQFALPEAVGLLRSIRRSASTGQLISVSAADPLNLIGILTPGGRVAALPANRVLYRDGEPIAVLEAGRINTLIELPASAEWEAQGALVRRRVPPLLREYLGQSA